MKNLLRTIAKSPERYKFLSFVFPQFQETGTQMYHFLLLLGTELRVLNMRGGMHSTATICKPSLGICVLIFNYVGCVCVSCRYMHHS